MSSNWRYVFRSERGTSHYATDTECQDNSHCDVMETTQGEAVLVAIACDGAGTARFSGDGAKLACSSFLDHLKIHFDSGQEFQALNKSFFSQWIDGFQSLIKEKAASLEVTDKEFACTFVAGVIGEKCAVFAQLGDGAIVIKRDEESPYAHVFWPQKGEFANTTYFVSQPDASDYLRLTFECTEIIEVAIMTDGLERLALSFELEMVHQPFFNSIFRPLQLCKEAGRIEGLSSSLGSFLRSSQVNERTDDDKTLVLACRAGASLNTTESISESGTRSTDLSAENQESSQSPTTIESSM